MLFKRILVPYDESKPSKEALEKAIDLAKVTDRAKPFVLHVVPQVPIPPLYNRSIRSSSKVMTVAEYYKEISQELKAKAKEMLERIEEKCERDGVKTEVQISRGNPACKIVEFAKDEKIELIIMGSRFADSIANNGGGRSARGKRIVRKVLLRNLGSVSRTVADRAPCPILLIRP